MNKNQSLRDLIFDPTLYTEYPYFYQKYNEDGTKTFIFSKTPILEPALEDEEKYKKVNVNEILGGKNVFASKTKV